MSKLINDKDSLLSALPQSCVRDDTKYKLADTIAQVLAEVAEQARLPTIFPNVDNLSEDILDALAYDLRVEWYDPQGTIAEKRKTIKECILIHRHKGTKYAVETALQSVYTQAKVREWNEYGGKPFHFQIIINDNTNDIERRNRILAKVKYYKNLRSVLEGTVFLVGLSSDIALKTGIKVCGCYKKIYTEVRNYGMD